MTEGHEKKNEKEGENTFHLSLKLYVKINKEFRWRIDFLPSRHGALQGKRGGGTTFCASICLRQNQQLPQKYNKIFRLCRCTV